MVGTILGPGTIFLMMVGAMNAITGMSNWNALLLNLIPILIYIIVCMTCKSEIQVSVYLPLSHKLGLPQDIVIFNPRAVRVMA